MTTILLEPAPPAWPAPRRPSALPREVASWRRETLAALDVDADRTVVATGHQAAVWHAGILAKDLAAIASSARLDAAGTPAAAIHFLADHDANDTGLVRLPVLDDRGRLDVVAWRWCPAPHDRPTRDRPAVTPSPPPDIRSPIDGLDARIEAVHEALAAHADQPTLAWQAGLATASLARPLVEDLPRRSMSSLLELPVGVAIIERLRLDPAACIRAHDAAIEADRDRRTRGGRRPRGMASLLERGAHPELPLWCVTAEGRRPATIEDLHHAAPGSLRPRALLATALARLGGCDLFIHGTGGAAYDLVMEDWIERWLGAEIADALAPATVASATARLDLPVVTIEDPITPEALHRMRFDPDLDRPSEEPPVRDALLQQIDAAPRRSEQRRAAFRRLHDAISIARRRGEPTLRDAASRLGTQDSARRANELAMDRTWAFPLLDQATLDDLRIGIERAWAAHPA